MITSDGCAWKPGRRTQFRLPPWLTPSGVNTKAWNATAATSAGQAIAFSLRTGIRASTMSTGTPTRAYLVWSRNWAYGDRPAASESTLELDSTMTRPSTSSSAVAPAST